MISIEEPFHKYKDAVYRLALSYTKSTADAENVCQSVFLKMMEQKTIAPGKEKDWLLKTIANTCRNLLRSSWWRKNGSLDDSIPADISPEYADVYQAVMALEPKYRVVIYLRYYEEYTTKEIAQLLRISQTAVTTRLSRGREMLKTTLKEGYL